MLRLLYLLSLVICIELSFCYNYLDDAAERHGHRVGRYARRDRVRRAKRPKERKSLIRHEYDYDRSPVEFDVASFIQPDDELVEEDGIPMRQRSNKRYVWYNRSLTIISLKVILITHFYFLSEMTISLTGIF